MYQNKGYCGVLRIKLQNKEYQRFSEGDRRLSRSVGGPGQRGKHADGAKAHDDGRLFPGLFSLRLSLGETGVQPRNVSS